MTIEQIKKRISILYKLREKVHKRLLDCDLETDELLKELINLVVKNDK